MQLAKEKKKMEARRLAFLVIMATLFAACSAGDKATDFLEKYGYLQKSHGSNRGEDRKPEVINAAIKNFQEFAGLKVTGVLDEETQQKMEQSRCGVKDIFSTETPAGMPANLKQGAEKWPKKELTWSIKNFSKTSKMSQEQQLYAIRQGFRRWSEVTPLIFREVTGKSDLELSFERYEHGDKDPFDGKGSILAHAFPPVDGRTHFDDDEDWTVGVDHGTNFEFVATHEIGHALGLNHLPGIDPIMSPFYPGYVPNFNLHRYDIMEIQRRYGKSERAPSSNLQKFCGQNYENINAAMRINGSADYLFVDRKMVISGLSGRKIFVTRMFPRGPKTVDAASFSKLTNTIYLFKGSKVWAFLAKAPEQFVLKNGFPKNVLNSETKKPEAAFKIKENFGMETIFLIKEGKLWVWLPYDERLAPGIGFPANVIFPGIPERMDAAISSENINFIVGKEFYENKPLGQLAKKRSNLTKSLLKCSK